MKLYLFLDRKNPPVAWAIMRGHLVSADNIEPDTLGFISFMLAGMLKNRNTSRLFNELIIEQIRRLEFPHQISRIRGMYFFQRKEDAISRIGDNEWPSFFMAENLVEVMFDSRVPYTTVDANWITYAPRDKNGQIKFGDLDWIRRYWKGEIYNNFPVWEIIADGSARIADIDIRKEAYSYVKSIWPTSELPILMARIAGEAGSDGGLIAPYLTRIDDTHLHLSYIANDKDFHDPIIIEKMRKHGDFPYLSGLYFGNKEFNRPDFREWFDIIDIEQSFPFP